MVDTNNPIEVTTDIAASPERVWALVSDLRNMAKWSPQCAKSIVRGGGPVQLGTKLFNINRRGLLVWPTRSKVVRFDAGKEIAFRIKDNKSVWSYSVAATPEGTRLTERRELPDGLTDISIKLTDRVLGGQERFREELQQGMQQTLQRIKAEAERG